VHDDKDRERQDGGREGDEGSPYDTLHASMVGNGQSSGAWWSR
jgi:hypothetical protein